MRTITLRGPFSDDEVCRFVALLREIDIRRPDNLYSITVQDADGSIEAGERLLRDALPPLSDRITAFANKVTDLYRDDSFPERHCDECGRPYRGPAVFCSLKCALAAA